MLIYLGLPAPASWPMAGASLLLNIGYTLALSAAYRRSDMAVVYPIARGGGTLFTTIAFILLMGETISAGALRGIGLLVAGILLMTWRFGPGGRPVSASGIGFALLTALIIGLLTVSDGLASRVSGNPIAYAALIFVLNGFLPLPVIYALRGRAGLAQIRDHIGTGFIGGAMGFVSYSTAVWAMARAPVPLVTAVRETSVLFGVAIAVFILKEPLHPGRIAAAALILAGLVLIRLG